MNIKVNPKILQNIRELPKTIEEDLGLFFCGEKTDRITHPLFYLCKDKDGQHRTNVIKKIPSNSPEVKFYTDYRTLIARSFETLIIPELTAHYRVQNYSYLVLPYYDGDTFDFNPPDPQFILAQQMVKVVSDLLAINVNSVVTNSSVFNHKSYEKQFWYFFAEALKIDLIAKNESDVLRSKAEAILISGRESQRMIISHDDFNPRNFILLKDRKLVLVDWEKIVAPLEHHLTYPWLKNWIHPKWQKSYASKFESSLPVKRKNIRFHLMIKSLELAVGEMGHHIKSKYKNQFPLQMAENHMKNFRHAIEGFNSLAELT